MKKGRIMWRWVMGETLPHMGFSELKDFGIFTSEYAAIARSRRMHQHNLIWETQTEHTLIFRVHGGRIHASAPRKNISRTVRKQALSTGKHSRTSRRPNTRGKGARTITCPHCRPPQAAHNVVASKVTNERTATPQSLKRSPYIFSGDSLQQEIIP
jgi:hypothetical protein